LAPEQTSLLTSLSCPAPYGAGGLGRHFAQLVESTRRAQALDVYYTVRPAHGDPAGRAISMQIADLAVRHTPLRLSPGRRSHVRSVLFDRAVAGSVGHSERYVAFSGHALRTFGATGNAEKVLVSPTAHVDLVAQRYAMARDRYGIESPWLNDAGRLRAIAEYELADVIQVSSTYARQSFVDAGIDPRKLQLVHLDLPARFERRTPPGPDRLFRVLYVGALTVAKGVPALVEAFSGLSGTAELVLVGGWTTRGMRTYLQRRMASDRRITCVAADPFQFLQAASVLVHPSFSDGFGYAPMEALACGVPVVVTEDTGMSEHVQEGLNGFVVATGDEAALLERLEAVRAAVTS
jgi:glycosyltransferase involved in cell wall biosynthesis